VGQPCYREARVGSYKLAALHKLEKMGVERMMTARRRTGVRQLAGGADDHDQCLLRSARLRVRGPWQDLVGGGGGSRQRERAAGLGDEVLVVDQAELEEELGLLVEPGADAYSTAAT
jgi:hypothetical protein